MDISPSEKAAARFAGALATHAQLDDLFLIATNRGMRAPFVALEGLTLLPARRICLQNIVANDEFSNEFIEWLTQS